MDPEPYGNSDMTHPHLSQEISGILKQKYLVPYQNNAGLAIGILFGPHARPIISLPVEPLGKKGEALSVHFFVDTAAPDYIFGRSSFESFIQSARSFSNWINKCEYLGNKASRKSISGGMVRDQYIGHQFLKKRKLHIWMLIWWGSIKWVLHAEEEAAKWLIEAIWLYAYYNSMLTLPKHVLQTHRPYESTP